MQIKIIRKYYEQLYANKLDRLEEMDKFLEACNLSRPNQDGIDNLNRLSSETEFVIFFFFNPQKTKVQDWMASQGNSTKRIKKK